MSQTASTPTPLTATSGYASVGFATSSYSASQYQYNLLSIGTASGSAASSVKSQYKASAIGISSGSSTCNAGLQQKYSAVGSITTSSTCAATSQGTSISVGSISSTSTCIASVLQHNSAVATASGLSSCYAEQPASRYSQQSMASFASSTFSSAAYSAGIIIPNDGLSSGTSTCNAVSGATMLTPGSGDHMILMTTGLSNWTLPNTFSAGNQIFVECWGAGGGGSSSFGGGGGGYASAFYTITALDIENGINFYIPQNSYGVNDGVAGAGGASWFLSTHIVAAIGGNGGNYDRSYGGDGGFAADCFGSKRYNGGQGLTGGGAAGSPFGSGNAGDDSGDFSNGGDASGAGLGGTIDSLSGESNQDGGGGGASSSGDNPAGDGGIPGGGGGASNNTSPGGIGAQGQIRITV